MPRPTDLIVRRLGYDDLVDLIWHASDEVVYCSPNVHPEVADALRDARSQHGIRVRVLIDPSEWSFRNGFGETKAVDKLISPDIDMREMQGLQIGFIAADDLAYFLFPQSRALVEEGAGDNAVKMDALTYERLLLHYFPPQNEVERAEAANRIHRASTDQNDRERDALLALEGSDEHQGAPVFDRQEYLETWLRLEENRPVQPDLRRKINVYVNKLQFVELEFKGAGFTAARIKLPDDAIPVSNPELRAALETRMRVFPDTDELKERDEFEPFFEMRDRVQAIRDKYFVHVPSRKKNVFAAAKKAALLTEIKAIDDDIEYLKARLEWVVEQEIMRARLLLRQEIEGLLRQNPPDKFSRLKGEYFYEAIASKAYEIVNGARFPTPFDVVEGFSLTYRFFDPTWDDFSDPDFLNELYEREVIPRKDVDELRSLRAAYETQRTEAS